MTEPRRGRGQPAFDPTEGNRRTVRVLRANGDPLAVIAANIGITEKTLRKHFRAELEDGHGQVRAAMGAAVVKAGLAGNVYAMKYWLSCFGGPEWRVVEARQIGGMEGALPIPITGGEVVHIYLPDNGRQPLKPDEEK
jgi:hypothetical protein